MERIFIALDVETTGLDAGVDEIIEVAAVKFRGSEVLETFQKLVRPRQSLPLKITRLTGITEEELADAPRFSAIAPDLVRFVKSYPIIGHSIGFDLSMLKAQGMTFAQPSYDTFEMATLLMPQAPIYRLSALAESLGIAHPEDHRALNDSDVCRQVFLHLIGRIEALSLNDLNEIARLTAKSNWPLRELFVEVQQARTRLALVEGTAARPTGDERPAQPFTPLKPTGDEGGVDLAAVTRFFAPDGPMGEAFEGYEQRAPQVEMAQAVARAFNNKEALLVEAGTGTGKCLSGDAWITFQSGRRQQLVEICRAQHLPDEPILSLTAAGKLTYQRVQAVYENGVRPVWRVSTALGRTITATTNHPLLTFEGWRALGDLEIGDRIATPRTLPMGDETHLLQQAFLIGALLGDGHCIQPVSIGFVNFDDDVVAAVASDVATLNNVELTRMQRVGHYGFKRLRLQEHERNGLIVLLQGLGILGRSAHSKHIPTPFFSADATTISRLLAGLWATDGTIEERDGHPSICFVSERMLREVQHLLLKLGVISRLRYKAVLYKGTRRNSWVLTVSDLESKAAFYRTVGQQLVGQKRRALDAWWAEHGHQQSNTNDDLLPIVAWDVIDQERQRAGKSWYALRNYCVVASDRTREISRAKMTLMSEFLNAPAPLDAVNSDVYWDRIVSIEPAGAVETFDLTMEGEPNFVANDIVVHNSMAYLAPAAMLAARRGERVVVSTNTINLQDQLYYKDIPALQRLLAQRDKETRRQGDKENNSEGVDDNALSPSPGLLVSPSSNAKPSTSETPTPPFTASILKGRGNYLCLRRYKALRRDDNLPSEEVRMLLKAQLWLPTTQTGDRAELLLVDREQAAWGKVNVTIDTCTGPACPDFRECFFFQARRRAEAAHVLVVNHALMLADLATESSVLPPYNHLIIDEAHNLEDVATDQLGFKVDQLGLTIFLDSIFQTGGALTVSGLLSELPGHFRESSAPPADAEKAQQISDTMRPAIERARQAVYDCFNRLVAFMAQEGGSNGAYDPRLRLVRAMRQKPAWAEIEQSWDNLRLQLTTLGDGLGKLHSLLLDLKDADLMSYDELMTKVEWLKRYCTEVRINIGAIIVGDDDGKITWLNHERGRDALTLNAAPLSVAELLNAGLFSQKDTVVLASATLSVANSFEFVRGRLGVREPAELQLESPFDYEHQALVYIPTDIPEPNQKGYQQAVEEALIKLCTATGGRTLALFTANSALRQTYAGIQDALEEHEIAVLAQGIDGSRSSLLQRFRESPRTVLLGTTSFWEGVDVVGDALSVLVIPKLPFAVPTDPIYSARSEGFTDAFGEYSVPLAILRFKQGFGRLIRSKEDRGIVVVLDKRLLTKKYGQQFLHSLPNTTVRTGALKQLPALAARFLV